MKLIKPLLDELMNYKLINLWPPPIKFFGSTRSHFHPSQSTLNSQYQSEGTTMHDTSRPMLQLQAFGSSTHISHLQTAVGQAVGEHQQSVFNADAILPNVNSLRQNSSISQSVSRIVATYEAQTEMEAPIGKNQHILKSGHFNATDTITSIPELRWSNAGYHSTSGSKRIVHDDLSLPEWAVGQLNNIYQIQDPVIVKKPSTDHHGP